MQLQVSNIHVTCSFVETVKRQIKINTVDVATTITHCSVPSQRTDQKKRLFLHIIKKIKRTFQCYTDHING